MLNGSGPRPSLFQARIGPWKGTWFVVPSTRLEDRDDVWIEVTPSQRKFRRHSEDYYPAVCDPERLTFEVLKWSKNPDTSCINRDFIPILADRGVPRPVLEQQAEAMLTNISDGSAPHCRRDIPLSNGSSLSERQDSAKTLKFRSLRHQLAKHSCCPM